MTGCNVISLFHWKSRPVRLLHFFSRDINNSFCCCLFSLSRPPAQSHRTRHTDISLREPRSAEPEIHPDRLLRPTARVYSRNPKSGPAENPFPNAKNVRETEKYGNRIIELFYNDVLVTSPVAGLILDPPYPEFSELGQRHKPAGAAAPKSARSRPSRSRAGGQPRSV